MIEEIVQRLVRVVGQRNVLSSPEDLYPYSLDASLQYRALPSLVVRPYTSEEVVEIVTLANREKIPIVARGGGTNFVGGVVHQTMLRRPPIQPQENSPETRTPPENAQLQRRNRQPNNNQARKQITFHSPPPQKA